MWVVISKLKIYNLEGNKIVQSQESAEILFGVNISTKIVYLLQVLFFAVSL